VKERSAKQTSDAHKRRRQASPTPRTTPAAADNARRDVQACCKQDRYHTATTDAAAKRPRSATRHRAGHGPATADNACHDAQASYKQDSQHRARHHRRGRFAAAEYATQPFQTRSLLRNDKPAAKRTRRVTNSVCNV
jgi:hypothetical protein